MTTMTEQETAELNVAAMTTDQIAAELQERVQALYRLNRELAAQCDRMGKVVDAAYEWRCMHLSDGELVVVVDEHKRQMTQLAKETDSGRGNRRR